MPLLYGVDPEAIGTHRTSVRVYIVTFQHVFTYPKIYKIISIINNFPLKLSFELATVISTQGILSQFLYPSPQSSLPYDLDASYFLWTSARPIRFLIFSRIPHTTQFLSIINLHFNYYFPKILFKKS